RHRGPARAPDGTGAPGQRRRAHSRPGGIPAVSSRWPSAPPSSRTDPRRKSAETARLVHLRRGCCRRRLFERTPARARAASADAVASWAITPYSRSNQTHVRVIHGATDRVDTPRTDVLIVSLVHATLRSTTGRWG